VRFATSSGVRYGTPSVADAGEAADMVPRPGGNVIVGVPGLLDLGRMAARTHPTGVAVGVWQPEKFAGARA